MKLILQNIQINDFDNIYNITKNINVMKYMGMGKVGIKIMLKILLIIIF